MKINTLKDPSFEDKMKREVEVTLTVEEISLIYAIFSKQKKPDTIDRIEESSYLPQKIKDFLLENTDVSDLTYSMYKEMLNFLENI